MKFGKDFTNHLEETLPEWRDKFLCYKYLKKLIKHHLPDSEHRLEDWFVNILNLELEKLNDFYIDKEEDFVIRLQEVGGFEIRSDGSKCGGVMGSGDQDAW